MRASTAAPWIAALLAVAGFAACAEGDRKSSSDDDDGDGTTISTGGSTSAPGSTTHAGTGGSVDCIAPADCVFLDDACNSGVCTAGICVAAPLPAGSSCGDPSSSSCDQPDACDGAGTCAPNSQPNGSACSEDLCSDNQQCSAGSCSGGTPKNCSSMTVGCNKGVCNASSGACTTMLETACMSGDGCCPSSCNESNDADCAFPGGTVRQVSGSVIGVAYVPCGTGAPGTCTGAVAKSSCAALGRKVVSHGSNGNSQVLTLGATVSCNWSVSYYTVDQVMPGGSCLVAVSNLDWSSCCGTSDWHGNSIPFAQPNQTFGYVYSSDSGYVSSNSNVSGGTWGCVPVSSAAGNYSGCSTQYVACAL